MLLELDVTFAHHEDMGESIGVMCGVSVHPDPRLKTLDREGSYIREYIKLHPRQADEPQYAPAVALPERPIEKVFALGCRQEFKCWDGSVATLGCSGSEHILWSLHKDNGMSYWGYTNDEIQRILAREVMSD
jgi:hypothetical protein